MKVYATVKTKDAAKINLFLDGNHILYHDADLKHGVTAMEAIEAFCVGAVVAGGGLDGLYLVDKCIPAHSNIPYTTLGASAASGDYYTIEKPVT